MLPSIINVVSIPNIKFNLYICIIKMLMDTYFIFYYIGGYLPTDGSPYICSFVTAGFVVTVVILTIWCIVGIIVSLVLLIIIFIWRENKLVNL